MASKTGPFIAKHGLRVVNTIAGIGEGMTVVGHISSTGTLFTSGGDIGSLLGISVSGDTFKSTSAWHSVSSKESTWDSTYALTYNLSGRWNSAYTTLNANSGIYTWVAENSASAGDGNSAFATLQSLSATWASTNTDVNANSGYWDQTVTTVRANSGDWASTGTAGGWTDDGTIVRLTEAGEKVGIGTTTPGEKLSVVGNISASGILYDGTNNSEEWNWSYSNLVSGTDLWNGTRTTLKTYSGAWASTNTEVRTGSADWRLGYLNSIAS